MPDFAAGAGFGNGYFHGHFMDIQPHIQYIYTCWAVADEAIRQGIFYPSFLKGGGGDFI